MVISQKPGGMGRILMFYLLSWFVYSRCCEKKSCGNKNETPSDPVIVDRYMNSNVANNIVKNLFLGVKS